MQHSVQTYDKIDGTTPMGETSTPPLTGRLREQEKAVPIVRIPLGNDKFAIVDEEDLPLLEPLIGRWCATKKKESVTEYVRARVWDKATKKYKSYSMHRMILQAKPGEIVDHINWDGLDNRRSNLRIVSATISSHNQPIQRNNTTGYRGVRPWAARFCAEIYKSGKYYWLGYHATAADAARAYDAKARELYGEYAVLNFPDEVAA